MKLEWSKIIGNAVTVLVATVFVGAAINLWEGVQTIDLRIDENLRGIRATQEVIAPKVDKLEEAMLEILKQQKELLKDKDKPLSPNFNFNGTPTIDLIEKKEQEGRLIYQQRQ